MPRNFLKLLTCTLPLLACSSSTPTPPVTVAAVRVTGSSNTLLVGTSMQLTATPVTSTGEPITGRPVTWNSSNNSTATVSSSGLVTGVAAGSATITAIVNEVPGSFAITVTAPATVASVRIVAPATTVQYEGTLQLAAEGLTAAGAVVPGRAVTWRTSNAAVANVNANGLVNGVAPGNATITATIDGIPATVSITVAAPVRPASRWEATMVYDTASKRIQLIGGSIVEGSGASAVSRFLGDVWGWNGSRWTLITLAGPTPRDGAVAGYDPITLRVVLHGGRDPQAVNGANPPLTDTWIASGSEWSKVSTVGPTPARHHAGGGFDERRAQLVLFGGGDPAVTHRDTWEWNGSVWTQRASTTPTALSAPSRAVYLTGRGALVMLVGTFFSGPTEFWQWSGSAWSKVGDGPTGAMPMQIAATGPNDVLIFDGGSGNTYYWNGSTTTRVSTTGPGLRAAPVMAYDASRHVVVLFGGYRGSSTLDDTWLWDGVSWSVAPPL